MVYEIPCEWLFEKRKKEHEEKVNLTLSGIEIGKLMSASEPMGKDDGGLAKHSVNCISAVSTGKKRKLWQKKLDGDRGKWEGLSQ